MDIKEVPALSAQGAHPAPCYGLFLIHFQATVDRGTKGLQSWSPLPLVGREACPVLLYCLGCIPWASEQLDHVQGWSQSPLTIELALGQVIQDACCGAVE